MKTLWALVTTQALSAWNRTLRESGAGGPVATIVALTVVVLVVALPGFITLRAGFGLGRRFADSGNPEALFFFCALQALFTVIFAICGGFRHRVVFTRRDVGMYPIPPLTLLVAEVPAGAIEVFPLLGGIGILCSNLGLALALPKAVPLIALLTLQGLLFMLLVQHLMGSVKRVFFKRPVAVALVGFGLAALVAARLVLEGGGPREAIRAAVKLVIPMLPGSQGYAGLADLLAGHVGTGLLRLAFMLVATAGLVIFTVWVHSRELATETRVSARRRNEPAVLRFSRPASGIARLHLKQLIDSRIGKTVFFLPLLMVGCLAIVQNLMKVAQSKGDILPHWMASMSSATTQLALFEVFLVMVIWLNAEIWTNHFGWDRGGLRTLMVLPLASRDLLLGKLLGVLGFTVLQAAVCVAPLLLFYRPSAAEIVGGLAAAGFAFVVVNAGGHLFSIRYPRPIVGGNAPNLPIYLSWVPGIVMLILALGIKTTHAVTAGGGPWAAPVVLLVMLGVAVAAYLKVLPIIGAVLEKNRERLVGM